MNVKKKNLAFFKGSRKSWTKAEVIELIKYTDPKANIPEITSESVLNNKYIYDDGCTTNAYYPWSKQNYDDENTLILSKFTVIDYEQWYKDKLTTFNIKEYR